MIYIDSVRDIAKGVFASTAQFAWGHGSHLFAKALFPIALITEEIAEKREAE